MWPSSPPEFGSLGRGPHSRSAWRFEDNLPAASERGQADDPQGARPLFTVLSILALPEITHLIFCRDLIGVCSGSVKGPGMAPRVVHVFVFLFYFC